MPLTTGELADLAARLNRMITDDELVIVFQPRADKTEFGFMAVESGSGKQGIIAIGKVAG